MVETDQQREEREYCFHKVKHIITSMIKYIRLHLLIEIRKKQTLDGWEVEHLSLLSHQINFQVSTSVQCEAKGHIGHTPSRDNPTKMNFKLYS